MPAPHLTGRDTAIDRETGTTIYATICSGPSGCVVDLYTPTGWTTVETPQCGLSGEWVRLTDRHVEFGPPAALHVSAKVGRDAATILTGDADLLERCAADAENEHMSGAQAVAMLRQTARLYRLAADAALHGRINA